MNIDINERAVFLKAIKNAALIINPKAGKQISEEKANEISSLLKERGYKTDVYFTEHRSHASEISQNCAADYDVIICCGGDGTLNETVSGIVNTIDPPPLGYIPTGTTNDFAKTLKLTKNLPAAANIISAEKATLLDVGLLNKEKYFTYIASFGAFTKVSYETPQSVKNKFGHLAYIMDGIKSIGEIRPHKATVTADGRIYSGDYVFGAVSNSVSIGGILNYRTNDVILDDGMFELLLIKVPKDHNDWSITAKNIFEQRFDEGGIVFTHAKKIAFEFEEDIPFTTDGEYAGTFKHIAIENLNKKLKLLVK